MRISDWSSDVCSSDLGACRHHRRLAHALAGVIVEERRGRLFQHFLVTALRRALAFAQMDRVAVVVGENLHFDMAWLFDVPLQQHPVTAERALRFALARGQGSRSEEHTSELQSLMRISYAVFCLKKKTQQSRLITLTTT